jgi:hypothetical protein
MPIVSVAIENSITVAAPPATVWRHLTDFAAMPEWNPFLIEAEGILVPGERLWIRARLSDEEMVELRPVVAELTPGSSFSWRGRLPVPGLLASEHYFRVEEAEGQTRLVQGVQARGLLLLVLRGVLQRTHAGLAAMNWALKARAEGS